MKLESQSIVVALLYIVTSLLCGCNPDPLLIHTLTPTSTITLTSTATLTQSPTLTSTLTLLPLTTPYEQALAGRTGDLTIAFTLLSPVQLTPGGVYAFEIGTIECCYGLQPVNVDVSWSIEPEIGAHIEGQTGVLNIDTSTPNGSIFTVTANVEKGKRLVSTKVYVYTHKENPFVGIWKEKSHLPCNTEQWVQNDSKELSYQPIGELAFNADGSFSVTWDPFEIHRDYWGVYTYNLDDGSLKLISTDGNYLPEGVDGIGSFSFDSNSLILKNIWLGSPSYKKTSVSCGYVFQNR